MRRDRDENRLCFCSKYGWALIREYFRPFPSISQRKKISQKYQKLWFLVNRVVHDSTHLSMLPGARKSRKHNCNRDLHDSCVIHAFPPPIHGSQWFINRFVSLALGIASNCKCRIVIHAILTTLLWTKKMSNATPKPF